MKNNKSVSKKDLKYFINEIKEDEITLANMFPIYRRRCKHKEVYTIGLVQSKFYNCELLKDQYPKECHWRYCPKLKG